MIAIYELSCNLELVELVHGDPEPNTIMCLSRQQQIISPSLIFFFFIVTQNYRAIYDGSLGLGNIFDLVVLISVRVL